MGAAPAEFNAAAIATGLEPELLALLRTPYELGGREPGYVIDCLGVVKTIAELRGLPGPDGWPSIRAAWEQGRAESASGFPPGWVQVAAIPVLRDLDVAIYDGSEPWCAIADRGRVWSACKERGVYWVPAVRWKLMPQCRRPLEVWRFRG